MADYRKLRVWQRSRKLTKHVFKLARKVKKAGEPELAAQMKRCVVSVPSNIAEGSEHASRKEFARFLRYSLASAAELETQLIIATDVEALYEWHGGAALRQNDGTMRMLKGLIKRIDPDEE